MLGVGDEPGMDASDCNIALEVGCAAEVVTAIMVMPCEVAARGGGTCPGESARAPGPRTPIPIATSAAALIDFERVRPLWVPRISGSFLDEKINGSMQVCCDRN